MNRAIFVDRDGVLNEVLSNRVKFVNKPSDFYWLPGSKEAIKRFNTNKYLVFVITNQGGVGLGFFKETHLQDIHQKMQADLKAIDAYVDGISYCSHKPNAGCACRKPGPKMITDLMKTHKIDPKKSYMVGDRLVDIEAGRNAGVKTVYVGKQPVPQEADLEFKSLKHFSDWLI